MSLHNFVIFRFDVINLHWFKMDLNNSLISIRSFIDRRDLREKCFDLGSSQKFNYNVGVCIMSIWIKCGRSKSNIYPNLWPIKVFAQIYILEFVLTSKDNQMRQIMHSGNGQNEQAKYSMSSPILSNYTKQIANFY